MLSNSKTPVSTNSVIVFPLCSDKRFSRTIYSPAMTEGRASSDDINCALNLFEVIFTRLTISKGDLWKSVFWKFLLPFGIIIMGFSERMFRYEGAIWTGFFMYCCIGIVYLLHDRSEQMKRAKNDIEIIIQTIQPGYLKRGLRWRIPEESNGWIELVKEYHGTEKVEGRDNIVKPQYEPLQNVLQEIKSTTTSYPPIYTVGLSSK